MPRENDLNKVLIISSGPTLVGNVAEMDLLVTDAIKSFLEEEIHVVLVNPNPATISTDKQAGVTTYLEPMTLPFLKRILRMEEPDAIVTAYGSTTSVKITRKLIQDGILSEMQIKLLTINPQTLALETPVKQAAFLKKLRIGVAKNWQLQPRTREALLAEVRQLSPNLTFPILITKKHRYVHSDHYHAKNSHELLTYFKTEAEIDEFSSQNYQLVEDLSGWEEIICNVIRDHDGNCLFVNFAGSLEPVQINSGDSTMVMPAITLSNDDLQNLKILARKLINHLNLVGIMCLHFAIKHTGTHLEAKLLSLKPRLTKSAIWAEKVMLYNVGYVLSKVALGYRLNEIIDPDSGLNAAIEPIQDNFAIRMPYWSLAESGKNHYALNSQTQASGEAIGIGRNFAAAFLKAITGTTNLELAHQVLHQSLAKTHAEIIAELTNYDEQHWIKLLAALATGLTEKELYPSLHLKHVYFQKLAAIVHIGQTLHDTQSEAVTLSSQLLTQAKIHGFSNELIALLSHQPLAEIDRLIDQAGLVPVYVQIDGTAGFYRPPVNAFYGAYDIQDEASVITNPKKLLIVGMLPLQVSVTSEFDYMLAHALKTLHKNNYFTVLLSNNDEAVSSRYRDVDRSYVEPISIENIVKIAQHEGINEVLLQFSGKKVISMAHALALRGLKVIGGSDGLKEKIHELLTRPLPGLSQVPSMTTTDHQQLDQFIAKYGFPLLIGGSSQQIKQKSAVVYDKPAMEQYLAETQLDRLVASLFIEGCKYEVIGISDSDTVTIPGVIEHLEQTGSHASDSIAVFKSQSLAAKDEQLMIQASINMLHQLSSIGIFTLHFLRANNALYLLQIKPYAGHNVAFLSQALGQDITACATNVLIGKKLKTMRFPEGTWESNQFIHVKMPVFSYIDYQSKNTFDSKMKSSGSVIGRDTQLAKALYKGYEASDLPIPSYGTIFISVRDQDKVAVTELANRFHLLGFKILATEGTANMFAEAGITTGVVTKIHDNSHNLLTKIRQHKVGMVINITNLSDAASQDAIAIRDQALYTHIPVCSTLETAKLVAKVLESLALTTLPI